MSFGTGSDVCGTAELASGAAGRPSPGAGAPEPVPPSADADPPPSPALALPPPAFFGSGRMSIGLGFAGLPHSAGSLIELERPSSGPAAGVAATRFLMVSHERPKFRRRNGPFA